MFREKCNHCRKKVSKKYEFCPYCGTNAKGNSGDYGFLGKQDLIDEEFKLPFGFNMLLKPLMKELNKQMKELDNELKKEKVTGTNEQPRVRREFSIMFGIPGQKPIRISSSGNRASASQTISSNPQNRGLPKIDSSRLDKIKKLPRKEPKTNVRRLSDRVIYELDVPGVQFTTDINISQLEEGLEIKAVADKVVFSKMINVKLPLLKCSLQSEKLILEMGLK